MSKTPLEKSLEKWFLNACAARGFKCLKLTGYKGIPDRMVLAPNGKLAFVELKKPAGGTVSELQQQWLSTLGKLGFTALATSSRERLAALLVELGHE